MRKKQEKEKPSVESVSLCKNGNLEAFELRNGLRCALETPPSGLLLLVGQCLAECGHSRHGSELGSVGLGHLGRASAADERPVDPLEERMGLDLPRAADGADSLHWVLHQEPPDELLGALRDIDCVRVGREDQGVRDNIRERELVVRALERRLRVQQLVQEDSESPPVHGAPVPITCQARDNTQSNVTTVHKTTEI